MAQLEKTLSRIEAALSGSSAHPPAAATRVLGFSRFLRLISGRQFISPYRRGSILGLNVQPSNHCRRQSNEAKNAINCRLPAAVAQSHRFRAQRRGKPRMSADLPGSECHCNEGTKAGHPPMGAVPAVTSPSRSQSKLSFAGGSRNIEGFHSLICDIGVAKGKQSSNVFDESERGADK